MEGKQLHPTVEPDGTHVFAPAEVFQVAKEFARRAVDPTRAGERDSRAFELLDAGHDLRDLVTTLRIPVDVAKHISTAWHEAGKNDVVVPRSCKTEIERCLGRFRDAAELVQRVRAAATEDDRMHDELSQAQNRLSKLVVFVGQIAARIPALADVLPKVRPTLDDELLHVLDDAFARGARDHASEAQPEPVLSGVATTSVVEVRGVEASRTRDENEGTEVGPAIDLEGVDGSTAATLVSAGGGATVGPVTVTGLNGVASDTAAAMSGAETGFPAAQPPREQLLDAWLHSVADDDAQLHRLAQLLAPAEKVMLAELASTIGTEIASPTGARSPREQMLDALFASITTDEERLEQIEAALDPNQRGMFADLRVYDPLRS